MSAAASAESELTALAMTISLVLAVPLGVLSAYRHNGPLDRAGTSFALFGICMPNFLLALLLIFVFGVTLRWLPISGYLDPLEEGWSGLRSLVLPAVTLGLALAAVVTRTLRSSMLEALTEDYVRTARAKGLSEWAVLRGHVLRNALIPVVTVLGLQLGTLIGGAVITEYVFALPGVGRLVVDAVFARDYPLVQGVVLLIALGFIASNCWSTCSTASSIHAEPPWLTAAGTAAPGGSRAAGAVRGRGALAALRGWPHRCVPYDPLKQNLQRAPPSRPICWARTTSAATCSRAWCGAPASHSWPASCRSRWPCWPVA